MICFSKMINSILAAGIIKLKIRLAFYFIYNNFITEYCYEKKKRTFLQQRNKIILRVYFPCTTDFVWCSFLPKYQILFSFQNIRTIGMRRNRCHQCAIHLFADICGITLLYYLLWQSLCRQHHMMLKVEKKEKTKLFICSYITLLPRKKMFLCLYI